MSSRKYWYPPETCNTRAELETIQITYKRDKAIKTGPICRMFEEWQAYMMLKVLLKDSYRRSMIEVFEYREFPNTRAAIVIERLPGRDSLQEYILKTIDERNRLRVITSMVEQTLEILRQWGGMGFVTSDEPFFNEVWESVKESLCQNPEAEGKMDELLTQIRGQRKAVPAGFEILSPRPCHRDLGANNIWPMPDGSVKFFDPRNCLPGAETLCAGNTVVDVAQLFVTIQRLNADRKRKGLKALEAERLVELAATRGTLSNNFNPVWWKLALLERYMFYWRCKCSFCLAPARAHRFVLMRELAFKTAGELVDILSGNKEDPWKNT